MQVVLSQVSCKKAKLKFSSPGGTAQRPLLGMWLVPMEPNWFQQSHLAATHRAAERLHLVPMNFKSDRTASYSMSTN